MNNLDPRCRLQHEHKTRGLVRTRLHPDGCRYDDDADRAGDHYPPGTPARIRTGRRTRTRSQHGRLTIGGECCGEPCRVHRGARRDSSEGLHYLRKLTMQLASKMRFVSAQFVALLTDDLWLRNAAHANAMATRLRTTLESAIASGAISDVSFSQPTQTNAVFAVLPPDVAARVREEFAFYDWNASTGEVRWMCAYDTTEADVDRFVACLVREVAAQRELARGTARP